MNELEQVENPEMLLRKVHGHRRRPRSDLGRKRLTPRRWCSLHDGLHALPMQTAEMCTDTTWSFTIAEFSQGSQGWQDNEVEPTARVAGSKRQQGRLRLAPAALPRSVAAGVVVVVVYRLSAAFCGPLVKTGHMGPLRVQPPAQIAVRKKQ